jgi:hypothetical protein
LLLFFVVASVNTKCDSHITLAINDIGVATWRMESVRFK